MSRWPLFAFAILALGCSRNAGDTSGHAGGYVECVVPRPQVCTKEYRPVCALRDTGIRCVTQPCDTWETKTYGNVCTACAEAAVYGWRPGECEEEGIVRHE